jgi:hypothetical protein
MNRTRSQLPSLPQTSRHPTRRLPALLALALSLSACGPAMDEDANWLFPLWVPTQVLVADIDSDGRADILTLAMLARSDTEREGRLLVRRQTAPGVFAPAVSYEVGHDPWKMALGDLNADGAPDLVVADVGVAHLGLPPALWLIRQNLGQRGSFLAPEALVVQPQRPYGVALADLNGDNALDIVLADSLAPGRGATLIYQDPGKPGDFSAPTLLSLPGDATEVATGDLNGDGRTDLAFRLFLEAIDFVPHTTLALVYQQPGGTLGTPLQLAAQQGLNTRLLTVVDWDRNGVPDLAEFFTPASVNYQARFTRLIQSNPPGSFTPAQTLLAGVPGLDGGVVADLNGDGLPDFATVGAYPVGSPSTILSSLHIMFNDGLGGLSMQPAISLPIASARVAAGDLNGDGLGDLVILGEDNRVFALLQLASARGSFGAPLFLN